MSPSPQYWSLNNNKQYGFGLTLKIIKNSSSTSEYEIKNINVVIWK